MRTSPRASGSLVDLRRRRRAGRQRRAAVAVLAVVTVAVAVASLWTASEVRVSGAERVPADRILAVSGLRGGERMLLTRLGPVERRVEALPEIRSADVRRSLWSALVIRVSERVALARLDARPQLAVDRDGRMFPAPDGVALPTLSGWRGRPRPGGRVDDASAAVLASFARFPETLRARTARIEIGKEIGAVLADGARIRFGSRDDLAAKAVAAQAVLTEADGRGAKLDYVDVRVPALPVAREVGQPTPAPSAEPGPDDTAD